MYTDHALKRFRQRIPGHDPQECADRASPNIPAKYRGRPWLLDRENEGERWFDRRSGAGFLVRPDPNANGRFVIITVVKADAGAGLALRPDRARFVRGSKKRPKRKPRPMWL